MIQNAPRKPQDERKSESPRNTPAGIGLLYGAFLFFVARGLLLVFGVELSGPWLAIYFLFSGFIAGYIGAWLEFRQN